MQDEPNLYKIVVVGGGAGGLELVTKLAHQFRRKKHIQVTLVDMKLTHIWKPLWHEVATGTLASSDNEIGYLLHSHFHGYTFELGSLVGLDRKNKRIQLGPISNSEGEIIAPARLLSYDTLIIAIGSICNDFNIPGVAEYCLTLDSQQQAEQFHRQFLQRCMHIEYNETISPLNIVVVGGGATGVELIAELQRVVSQIHDFGWQNVNLNTIKLSIIESSDRLLQTLKPKLSAAIHDDLSKRGITIYTSQRVQRIQSNAIITAQGLTIAADMVVWAAGIKAPIILTQLDGLEINAINQLIVHQTLQTTVDKDIFAFGDCAYCPQINSGKAVPPRAQAAHQQATLLVKTMQAHLADKSLPIYYYKDHGSLISLSQHNAVGQLMSYIPGSLFLEGRIAQFLYWLLFKEHQAVLLGIWR
ncbi:MAG: NAD(P)/FAD-dependent oxidoreductase, partial [Gammaproteobacteria bacterium]